MVIGIGIIKAYLRTEYKNTMFIFNLTFVHYIYIRATQLNW